MATTSPLSLLEQAWRWSTSSTVRAQRQAERTFLAFLSSDHHDVLDNVQALRDSLTGADPDLVNRPLPIPFTPKDQPGIRPLMWALLSRRWKLAKNLLDLGADPTPHVPDSVLMAYVGHLQKNLPHHLRLPLSPNSARSPLSVAIQLADKAWEDAHFHEVRAAWIDGSKSPPSYPAVALDRYSDLGPLLTTLFARQDLPWSVPDTLMEDPNDRASSAPIHGLVSQGSSLMGWPDAWLRRMNLDWHSPRCNLFGLALSGCFVVDRFRDLDHVPAYSRLRALGLDPQAHVTDWINHPTQFIFQAVVVGPLKPEALLDLLDDPALDVSVRNRKGQTLWDRLLVPGALSESRLHAAQATLDTLHARKVQREAQELRRSMRQSGTHHLESSRVRLRPRL